MLSTAPGASTSALTASLLVPDVPCPVGLPLSEHQLGVPALEETRKGREWWQTKHRQGILDTPESPNGPQRRGLLQTTSRL